MEATIERPARVVNHATNAFKAPEEQPTAQELEAEMMAALMPQPPSLGDDDQAGEDSQQGTGEKNEQKQDKKPQDAKSKQSKDGKPADQKKPQDGEQDQKQGGDQSQPQDGSEENGAEQQQGQQGAGKQGSAGQGCEATGQADQSAECQLEPEDREGLPDADAEKFGQKMVEKMLDALMGKQDEPEEQHGSGEGDSEEQGRNNERGKAGEHGEGNGKPVGDAEHESFDDKFKDVGSEARVLSNKKGEKVETILTNAQAVEHLRVTTNNFGRNLYAKYRQFGKLTGEQMFWAHKIAMESLHPHYKTTLI